MYLNQTHNCHIRDRLHQNLCKSHNLIENVLRPRDGDSLHNEKNYVKIDMRDYF